MGGRQITLTPKQERYALGLYAGKSQRQAYIDAGYSQSQSPATLDRNASALARHTLIITRLQGLTAQEALEKVASVQERKEILSAILRATVQDYTDADGRIDLDNARYGSHAVSEVVSRTIAGRAGELAVVENLKLHSPIQAIEALNKMDSGNQQTTVNVLVDNRGLIDETRERLKLRLSQPAD